MDSIVIPPHAMSQIGVRRVCASWLVAAVVACSVAGCSNEMVRPDLGRLYRVSAVAPDTTPLIVVPGLFGSKLRDRTTRAEVWPGDWKRIVFDDYADLELKFDPETLEVKPDNLEAFAIAEQVLGQDFYGPIIETLVRYGGYVRAVPGTRVQPGERRYYIFTYDWRQDNVVHARELDRLIEQIRADYGDPKLRVDIVAHSMGGLVSRYYLRYGPVDVLDGTPQLITLYGTARVRKLILLGTPNFGAISSLHAYLTGEPIGLKRMLPEVLATMPSGYQLFPHPIATWLIDIDGNPLPESLFDPDVWQRYRWGVYDPAVEARLRATRGAAADAYMAALRRYFALRLERARRLAWMLSTPEPSSPIRYVLFGGDCQLTPARMALEMENGVPHARMNPADIRAPRPNVPYGELMIEPGDGRVTKPSLLARETLDPTAPQHEESFLPVAYWFFLCERHDRLTSNINFQDNLLNVLLTRQLPWEMNVRPPEGQIKAGAPSAQGISAR
jgi:pimeloyl-ACP methyl ester carboxylesterase